MDEKDDKNENEILTCVHCPFDRGTEPRTMQVTKQVEWMPNDTRFRSRFNKTRENDS